MHGRPFLATDAVKAVNSQKRGFSAQTDVEKGRRTEKHCYREMCVCVCINFHRYDPSEIKSKCLIASMLLCFLQRVAKWE